MRVGRRLELEVAFAGWSFGSLAAKIGNYDKRGWTWPITWPPLGFPSSLLKFVTFLVSKTLSFQHYIFCMSFPGSGIKNYLSLKTDETGSNHGVQKAGFACDGFKDGIHIV